MRDGRRWTQQENDELLRLWKTGASDDRIAEALGRTLSAVQSHISELRRRRADLPSRRWGGELPRRAEIVKAPPEDVLAERDRALARERSLTAIVFGDPLPGRSALDWRRAEHRPLTFAPAGER